MLRKYGNHFGILIKGVLFEDPVSLQAQFNIPKCSKGIGLGKLHLLSPAMVLAETPKLDKGGHKLNLVALGADMSQTDHQVIGEQALDDDAGVNSSEIEVDGESVDHVELIHIDEVFKDVLELCLGDVLDPSMFYKFLQNFKEDQF